MPSAWLWRCGHCGWEPMTRGIDSHCCSCGRREDGYATYYKATSKVSTGYRDDTNQSHIQSHSILCSHSSPYLPQTIDSRTESEGYRLGLRGQAPHHTASAPPPAYQPLTYGPPQWWWCCQCKDGPKSTSHQPRCVVCQHTCCSYCSRK